MREEDVSVAVPREGALLLDREDCCCCSNTREEEGAEALRIRNNDNSNRNTAVYNGFDEQDCTNGVDVDVGAEEDTRAFVVQRGA